MGRNKKQMFKALLLSSIVLIGLVIFQNCAPAKQQQVTESSSVGLINTSSVSVSGRCGSSLNSCVSGALQNIADNTTHTWWRCNGSGGGASVSCSLPITASGPISGLCSSSVNSCLQGDLLDTADTATQFVWSCRGINSGTSVTCRVNKPTDPTAVSGVCGINNNACTDGTLFDTADTQTEYLWECRGSNGGVTRSCSQSIASAPVIGVCSGSSENCTSGDFIDQDDSPIKFVWMCRGRNGGQSNSCELSKPVCTISNGTTNNTPAPVYFRDSFTYSVRATSGTLPNRIDVVLMGTRAGTNGVGFVTDNSPDTTTTFNIATTGNIVRTFSAAADAGVYVRSAKVYHPDTGKELCQTTNTTTHNLLPLCRLSASTDSVNLSQPITFSATFPASGHSELGATPNYIVWYSTRVASGTTTAVPDEYDGRSLSVSSLPHTFTAGTTNTQYVGSYTRYFVARDSSNRALCRSNSVAFEITAMPPPPPPPPPPPTTPPVDDTQTTTPTGGTGTGGTGGGGGGGGGSFDTQLN